MLKRVLKSYLHQGLIRRFCEQTSNSPKASCTGLSSKVIIPTDKPVGPSVDTSKSGAYKVPEYFCYHQMSYAEAEIELAQYRLPQPSSLKN